MAPSHLGRLATVLALLLSWTAAAYAATLPPGFSETPLTSALNAPTAMALAPDGRLFVCEQIGELRVIKNDSLLPTSFVSLSVDSTGERGLLGVAFDPNFASNHFVYVYYTTSAAPVHNRISRFTANGDVAAPGSEVVLLELDNLSSASNHNGGAVHFGPDGKLYAGVGENANGANAQTLDNLLGKILRINADGTIPADNPFFGTAIGKNRAIWALGLRNPFTFAFNRATGRMLIDDVGQNMWEEINDGIAGSNYGWPQTEGPQPSGIAGVRYPIYSYFHDSGVCAITGGAFYDPATPRFPADYTGDYFFADLCAGWMRRLDLATLTVTDFVAEIPNPVDVVVSPDGALYYLARGVGSVFRVTFTGTLPGAHFSSPGVYYPATATYYLRLSNTTGINDIPAISYGVPGGVPLVGDWNGDGISTVGMYWPLDSTWYLRNSNTTGFADLPRIKYGTPGDIPLVGDWNGDGIDTIGVYRPSSRAFFLRNSNTTGFADMAPIVFGNNGDIPVVGDWNGDGSDTVGVFRPSSGAWYLRNSNEAAINDVSGVVYGVPGDVPVVGDWNGDGIDTVGVFKPSTGLWLLRDSNSSGFNTVPAFIYGTPPGRPIPGKWR